MNKCADYTLDDITGTAKALLVTNPHKGWLHQASDMLRDYADTLSQQPECAEAVAKADAFFGPGGGLNKSDWQTIRARLVELEAENERLRGMLRDGVQE